MTIDWEGDGRRAVMQELAEEAVLRRESLFLRADSGGHSAHRAWRAFRVEYCGLDVVVSDRALGIELIRRVLQDVGCPQGAMLEEYVPTYSELPIWPD